MAGDTAVDAVDVIVADAFDVADADVVGSDTFEGRFHVENMGVADGDSGGLAVAVAFSTVALAAVVLTPPCSRRAAIVRSDGVKLPRIVDSVGAALVDAPRFKEGVDVGVGDGDGVGSAGGTHIVGAGPKAHPRVPFNSASTRYAYPARRLPAGSVSAMPDPVRVTRCTPSAAGPSPKSRPEAAAVGTPTSDHVTFTACMRKPAGGVSVMPVEEAGVTVPLGPGDRDEVAADTRPAAAAPGPCEEVVAFAPASAAADDIGPADHGSHQDAGATGVPWAYISVPLNASSSAKRTRSSPGRTKAAATAAAAGSAPTAAAAMAAAAVAPRPAIAAAADATPFHSGGAALPRAESRAATNSEKASELVPTRTGAGRRRSARDARRGERRKPRPAASLATRTSGAGEDDGEGERDIPGSSRVDDGVGDGVRDGVGDGVAVVVPVAVAVDDGVPVAVADSVDNEEAVADDVGNADTVAAADEELVGLAVRDAAADCDAVADAVCVIEADVDDVELADAVAVREADADAVAVADADDVGRGRALTGRPGIGIGQSASSVRSVMATDVGQSADGMPAGGSPPPPTPPAPSSVTVTFNSSAFGGHASHGTYPFEESRIEFSHQTLTEDVDTAGNTPGSASTTQLATAEDTPPGGRAVAGGGLTTTVAFVAALADTNKGRSYADSSLSSSMTNRPNGGVRHSAGGTPKAGAAPPSPSPPHADAFAHTRTRATVPNPNPRRASGAYPVGTPIAVPLASWRATKMWNAPPTPGVSPAKGVHGDTTNSMDASSMPQENDRGTTNGPSPFGSGACGTDTSRDAAELSVPSHTLASASPLLAKPNGAYRRTVTEKTVGSATDVSLPPVREPVEVLLPPPSTTTRISTGCMKYSVLQPRYTDEFGAGPALPPPLDQPWMGRPGGYPGCGTYSAHAAGVRHRRNT